MGYRIWDFGCWMEDIVMNYEELDVYKESHNFVLEIYKVTKTFPNDEKYRLVDQLTRAAYSIPSNIAEGNSRNTTKDYINFLYMARGSANEIKYFLLLSKDLKYIDEETYSELRNKVVIIIKLLNGLINSLRGKLNEKN
jgi:four helix bundle protein